MIIWFIKYDISGVPMVENDSLKFLITDIKLLGFFFQHIWIQDLSMVNAIYHIRVVWVCVLYVHVTGWSHAHTM